MRKLEARQLHYTANRNTPKGVGKTAMLEGISDKIRKHPPRAWGKRIHTRAADKPLEKTPTGVGKRRMQLGGLGVPGNTPKKLGEDLQQ